MRILFAITTFAATPAFAHSEAAGMHIQHSAYAIAVFAGVVVFAAYKTLRR